MLKLDNIEVAYDKVQVLFEVSFDVKAGEILCLLGRNGAGKTTALKSIMGLLPLKSGGIVFNGRFLNALPPFEVPKQGIAYVPQGRELFSELTVAQNIEIGLMVKGSGRETRERVLDMFPRLRERLKQQAHYLMGGDPLLLSFIVVIIGGLGSIPGTIVAAILIGMSDGIISVFFSPTLAKILATLLVAFVLIFRPEGLFGKRTT